MTETGASVIQYPEKKDCYTQRQFKVVDADIRLGLALMAEHVYCVDGHKQYFDLPGFRMVGLDVYRKFIGVDTKIEDGVISDVDVEVSTKTGWMQHNARAYLTRKAGVDSIKDKKYTFKFENNRYKILDDKHFIKDFTATDEIIYFSEVNSALMGETNSGNEDKSPIGSGEYGILNPCGFKAAIYERTSDEYDYSIFAGENNGWDLSKVKYVLCISGTDDISIKEDWIRANLNQGLAGGPTYSLQYKLAELTAIKVAGSCYFNKGEWLIVGHSLGGGLTSAASVASGIPAITFNASGLNVFSFADYAKKLTGQSLSHLLPNCVSNIPPVGFMLDELSFLNVVQNRTICESIKSIEKKQVIAYRSTTDLLTSTQDNVSGSKNNRKSILNIIVLTVTPFALPIGVPVAFALLSYITDGAPHTFGDRRDVPTEYVETYKSPCAGSYLKVANEDVGHGMQMLVDGLINMIHKINNHLVTLQSGGLDNKSMRDNIISRYWYVPSEDANSDGGKKIKLVYTQYDDGDQSLTANKENVTYPVYGFVDKKMKSAIVLQDDEIGTGFDVWRKSTSNTSNGSNNHLYEQLNCVSQEPSHHNRKNDQREIQKEKLTKVIVEQSVGWYGDSTKRKIKELFGIMEDCCNEDTRIAENKPKGWTTGYMEDFMKRQNGPTGVGYLS